MLALFGWLCAFATAVAFVSLFFRPPLPSDIFAEAAVARGKLIAFQAVVIAQQTKFNRLADFSPKTARVVEQEGLRHSMDAARRTMDDAVALYNGEITTLLQTNKLSGLPRLAALLDHTVALAEDAERLAAAVTARTEILSHADAAPSAVLAEMRAIPREVVRLAEQLSEPIRQTGETFPHKRDDLFGRLTKLDSCPPPSVATERRPAPKGAPAFPPPPPATAPCTGIAADGLAQAEATPLGNLARLADHLAEMRGRLHHARLRHSDIRSHMADLPRTWVVRLTDMSMTCFASFTVYSWDERVESEGANYPLPRREIPCDAFIRLSALGDEDPVAWPGLASFKSVVPLATLGIHNLKPMPGHNTVEVHVAELEAKYRHGLATFIDSATHFNWTEVDEDTFIEHQNDLGMDIKVKPAGLYAEEALEEASPPGLALVGEHYTGQWEEHGGRRVWSWSSAYQPFFAAAFINGTRQSWDEAEWRLWTDQYRGRAPYYGKRHADKEEQRPSGGSGGGGSSGSWAYDWGSEGKRTRDTAGHADSTYRKTNVPRLPEDSVRGAGEATRGGGPGGGGK